MHTHAPMTAIRIAAVALTALVLIALTACTGDSDDGSPTATAEQQATTAQKTAAPTTTQNEERQPGELGTAPVFWRTADQFETIRAGEPYKIVLRVTNGYSEPSIIIVAERESNDGTMLEFEADRADPTASEEPGAFYPFNIDLPEQGQWILTALAGEGSGSIIVSVKPGSS